MDVMMLKQRPHVVKNNNNNNNNNTITTATATNTKNNKKNNNNNKRVGFRPEDIEAGTEIALRRRNRVPPEEPDFYYLDRLFDPEQLDYTPMSELIKRYKKRNLRYGRMYNLARKYGEVPTTRHRVLIAPKMERSIRRVLFDSYEFYKPPEKQYLCCDEAKPAKGSATPTRLTLPQPLVVRFASGTAAGGDAESDTNDEDSEERSANGATLSYEEQMRRRKELRSIVDKCELSLDYLHRKSDKTGLEEKIVHEMEVKRRGHEKLFSEISRNYFDIQQTKSYLIKSMMATNTDEQHQHQHQMSMPHQGRLSSLANANKRNIKMHQSFRFDPSIRTHSIPHMNNTTTTDNYSMIESVDSVDGGDTAAAAAATATTLHLPSIYSSNNSGSSNSRYSQSKKG